MSYERKTVDIWEIQGNYGYGWDMLCWEETRADAKAQLRCYNENERNAMHRIRHRRIPKEKYAAADFRGR